MNTVTEAIALLLEGKVVAVPTETVYGLAAEATNPLAIARIFEIKNRPADNPLICHFKNISQAEEYVAGVSRNSRKLIEAFTPGPVSFMLDLPPESPLLFATCGRRQVIIRIPDHPLMLEIITGLNKPLAAPSANTSGRLSPTSAQMVESDLGNRVDGIVDGGPCSVGLESTILDARSDDYVRMLRPGKIGKAEIEMMLPGIPVVSEAEASGVTTPGTKYRHYAPRTPLILLDQLEPFHVPRNSGLLLTREKMDQLPSSLLSYAAANQITMVSLGSVNDAVEAARHLYERLNRLDSFHLPVAYLLKTDWGPSALGHALANRLEKMVSVMDTTRK